MGAHDADQQLFFFHSNLLLFLLEPLSPHLVIRSFLFFYRGGKQTRHWLLSSQTRPLIKLLPANCDSRTTSNKCPT